VMIIIRQSQTRMRATIKFWNNNIAQPAFQQAKLETFQIEIQSANLLLEVDPTHELPDGIHSTV